uniref:Tiorf48 protein n=1 Tax=Agrobacterium tumefaciens TaxID=358 RepID=Q9R6L1_AGRTU|nr:tiorf48 [Agrobacterium tumefaciens]
MRDDDRIPGRRRRARQEPGPLVLRKIRLVGNEDTSRWIERQELACRLRKAMPRHDLHRLGDQAETPLLHDACRHRHGFAGADGMGKIGRAGRDDPPDPALLVSIKNKGARGAWKVEMISAELSRCDVVEAVIIDAREPVGAIGIRPYPALEGVLDLVKLFLCSLGIDDVENPPFAVAIPDRIEDLRHPAVQGIGQQFACVAAVRSPFGRSRGQIAELSGLDGP